MMSGHDRYGFSPITRRPHHRWPNGAGLAVYVAVGVEEYAFGEGLTENIIPATPKPDMVNTSWRDYGNRVGGFRLLERLSQHGIRPGILLNTAVYDSAPDLLRAATAFGAEIVGHGIVNSDTLVGMCASEERAYLRAVADRITLEQGARPMGWSSPWLAQGPLTPEHLVAEGYSYLLDLRLDDQPVWLRTDAGPLLSLPYALELNDSSTMIGRQTTARDFADMIIDEFDELLEAAEEQALVMSIVVHSFISGQPFRLRALSRAFAHIAAHGERIWLARPGDIAAHIAAHPELAV